ARALPRWWRGVVAIAWMGRSGGRRRGVMWTTAEKRLALVILSALAVLVGAPCYVFGLYLPRFVTGQASIARAPGKRSALAVPEAPRSLLLVIVDGLGYRFMRELPELAWLRERGTIRPLWTAF